MLKYAKSVPYIPNPTRSRPFVSGEQRKMAAQMPPIPVPFHCKPWVDGQSIGWTIYYPWLTPVTVVGLGDGKVRVDNLEQLGRETQQPKVVDQFAPGHFGIASGLTIQSPPGLVSMILPPAKPPSGLKNVLGVVETDWYPRQLFVVFYAPPKGATIELDYQMPFGRVVLLPRHDSFEAQPMTEAEAADMEARRQAYLAEEGTTGTSWQAHTGDSFTHLYKNFSRKHKADGGTTAE